MAGSLAAEVRFHGGWWQNGIFYRDVDNREYLSVLNGRDRHAETLRQLSQRRQTDSRVTDRFVNQVRQVSVHRLIREVSFSWPFHGRGPNAV